ECSQGLLARAASRSRWRPSGVRPRRLARLALAAAARRGSGQGGLWLIVEVPLGPVRRFQFGAQATFPLGVGAAVRGPGRHLPGAAGWWAALGAWPGPPALAVAPQGQGAAAELGHEPRHGGMVGRDLGRPLAAAGLDVQDANGVVRPD